MVEELLQTAGDILTVLASLDIMSFAIILEHPDRFFESAESHKKFDTLIPRHSAIGVIMHDKEGSIDTVGEEDWRIGDILRSFLPEGTADAALALFILSLAGIA